MRYIAEKTDFKLHNSVVTLGKFDGLHLGHQMLVKHVVDLKRNGYQSVMFTFSLHPSNLFSDTEVELIYTEEEKVKRLKELGIDVLIAYPFTMETASLSAESFIKEVLVEKLDAKVIVVGSDYRFGHKRQGDIHLLQQYAEECGYEVIVYDKVIIDKEEVSSTRIRNEIQAGHMEQVTRLLGKPYSITGEVLHGKKLGRTLGMPTVNLVPADYKLLPPNGVYTSKTIIDGISYDSVTNVGIKPTVSEEKVRNVETYIFDYDGNLYGRCIEVEFYYYQRQEKRFDSLEQLKEQMQIDIQTAKEYKYCNVKRLP